MQSIKLCVYASDSGDRTGSVVDDRVYDLTSCCETYLTKSKGAAGAGPLANMMVPSDLGAFLRGGNDALAAAREALAWVLAEGASQGPSGEALFVPLADTRLRAPVVPTAKLVCMGEMYKSHVELAGRDYIPYPVFFTKMTALAVGHDDYVDIPADHDGPVVYGTELTLIMGKEGYRIPVESAMDHVWGYTVFNDMTCRGQINAGSGKEFDTSAPTGPWVIPADEVAEPQNMKLSFRMNGETVAMQEGNTKDMRFTIAECIAEVSKWYTLRPGDVIPTGDVGAKEPPAKPGDLMEAEIEGIGVLRNPVRLKE